MRPRAYWLGDDWVTPGAYDIAGTPCEGVILGGELFQIPDHVVEHYPRNGFLQEQEPTSYTGMAFKNGEGRVIGHLAVLDRKPLPEEARFMALFELFGARGGRRPRKCCGLRRDICTGRSTGPWTVSSISTPRCRSPS